MLTPSFKLSQDNDTVTIELQCKYIGSKDVEVSLEEGTEFRFHFGHYFLRLHFPGRLVEEGYKSSYDVGQGLVTFVFAKETPGETFEKLDMPAALLEAKANAMVTRPMIQVLNDDSTSLDPNDFDEDFDWSLPQTLIQEELLTKVGFCNMYPVPLSSIHQLTMGIVETDVTASFASRRDERVELEDLKFDEDHYMFDFVNESELEPFLSFKPQSWFALKEIQESKIEGQVHAYLQFNEDQQRQMMDLGSRDFLLDSSATKSLYLGLVDILFAYAYDHRVNQGESTVESYWSYAKLSSTLSCFESFDTLSEVVMASMRRSLAYPLYRNYKLSSKVLQDVIVLFKLGRRAILQVLLKIKHAFDREESTHILAQLYLSDYCIWIQKASDKAIKTLASELNKYVFDRETIGWDLNALETLAREIKDEEGESAMQE